jgi:hypothetical protein
MRPSTRQYRGKAGLIVAAGVAARSATLSELEKNSVVESMLAPPLGRPIAAAGIGAATEAQTTFGSGGSGVEVHPVNTARAAATQA